MLNPCLCGSRGVSVQPFGAAFFVKCPSCGWKTSPYREKDMAIAAFNEMCPMGRPTKLLIRYSELSHWSAMQDDKTVEIYALEFDDKRGGYWISLRWL